MELQYLYYRFDYPSIGKLQNVLERAGHDINREILEYLTKYYKKYQKYNRFPNRFKFNLRDNVNFNYSVIINIFYINGKSILYIINEDTRYQAG